MSVVRASNAVLSVLLLAATLLAGCASRVVLYPVPVEDKGVGAKRPVTPLPSASEPASSATKPPPGAENAGKPGYYTVKPGDTLIRIGLDSGQNWRDIGRWNKLENPNQIEAGQVLQVVPTQQLAAVAAAASAEQTGVVTRPVGSTTVAPVQPGAVPPPRVASAPVALAAASEEELAWIWPAAGGVLKGFDEVTKKGGLDLGGKAGDPVLAAMDGQVMYAGAGLRGYGNLVIIKHNNTYISAYAHNQTLLVKEDQRVQKGQKIAEMGNTDAERVMLHFEIRRLGKPVDPAKFLPSR